MLTNGFGDGRLVPFTDAIWTATTPVRFAGTWFPHVMSVVRLARGDVVLHSPCRPSDDLIGAIRRLGGVAHVIAPNWFHDLYLTEYRRLYPNALFWGPAFLQRQRKALIDHVLNDAARPPWFDEMPHLTLSGLLTFDESVFFHTATRTLIVADVLTNAAAAGAPFLTRLGYRFLGLNGELQVFPILRWLGVTSNASFRPAAQRIVEWNPDRLIVAHGEPIAYDAGAKVRAALRGVATTR